MEKTEKTTQSKEVKIPKYPVQTVEKALEVFDLLSGDNYREGISISELSKEMKLGKSTVHRIMETMVAKNYIEQNEESKRYQLGWKLFEVGNVIPRQRNLYNVDKQILQELCDRCEETVNLGVRVKDSVVTISKISPKTSLIANLQIGARESLHATAMGKVLLSEMTREEVILIFGDTPFEAYTSNTLTNMDDLMTELEKIRHQGYSIDDEEFCAGLTCVAMPVRDYKNEIVAAVSVSGASIRMTFNKISQIQAGLKDATNRLSVFLGWQG
ncbi:IclR family transcriptional regulator [Anoxynatronum buryatiense]|uniref:Glycerol operon regulatory protein n=1 Tax=Anoxynatronum buryatiense TaxID=489973 RepID=A0AA45WWN6_9CLOT|nr:IclR family transcriptional regulator [Anoxynatronum buryatiense]SMP60270.1 transcriptional regulator, IclR family [Anoxynatronum buryatiense]